MNTRCLQLIKTDIVVIGGGPAGMMAAGTAAEYGEVILLEPNTKLGRKLRITGKGRCNVTNACDVRTFMGNVPRNPKFLYSSVTAFPPHAVMTFFEEHGVPLKVERGNRVFPQSDSANDIADSLVKWIGRCGVKTLKQRATLIEADESNTVCCVHTDQTIIACKSVILCTGGISYPGTGSTGDGYKMAQALGHTVLPGRASLVPLESSDSFCGELAGFAPRNVTLSVLEDEKLLYREQGEMLFAHFGVTGPLILSASAHMRNFEKCRYKLLIDFKPALDEKKLDARILRDFEKYKNRDFSNALSDLVPRTMIPVLVRLSEIPPHTKIHSITKEQRHTLISLLKAFPVSISGTRPIEDAIVTSGGIDIREVDPRKMASKIVSGLFFAGEILDVDAYTGGFNLQIAWSTGRCAGLAAGKELLE